MNPSDRSRPFWPRNQDGTPPTRSQKEAALRKAFLACDTAAQKRLLQFARSLNAALEESS